jgi:hypothetical protein
VHRRPSASGYAETAHHGDGDEITSDAVASTIDVSAMLG